MMDDIPNGVVVALILVVLIVSIAGTWVVLERTDTDNLQTQTNAGNNGGNVGFMIVEEPSNTGTSSANVAFTITK